MTARYEDIPVRYGGFVIADLDGTPDDGRRYELLDGTLLVSPAPRWEHQLASMKLVSLLHSTCPEHLDLLPTIGVRQGERTCVQPDLSIVRSEHLVRGEPFSSVPVVVAEILSPSSIGIDKLLKRDVYARLGVAHYWIVDVDEPSVTVLELHDGTFHESHVAKGDELLEVTKPFALALRPTDLTDV